MLLKSYSESTKPIEKGITLQVIYLDLSQLNNLIDSCNLRQWKK